jgi:hypothetical protein
MYVQPLEINEQKGPRFGGCYPFNEKGMVTCYPTRPLEELYGVTLVQAFGQDLRFGPSCFISLVIFGSFGVECRDVSKIVRIGDQLADFFPVILHPVPQLRVSRSSFRYSREPAQRVLLLPSNLEVLVATPPA